MAKDRDKRLAIPFNDGFVCPLCKSVGIGLRWKTKNAKYCPSCGQRIELMELRDWKLLETRVKRIRNNESLIETTTYIDSNGLGKQIAGIYVDELRKMEKQSADPEEGQQMRLAL